MPCHRTCPRRHDMAAKFTESGLAYPHLGWARRPGQHGGGAPAWCVGPLMSALILRFLLIKEKEQKNSPSPCGFMEKL